MRELLDIIQIPFIDETEAAEHFQRLDLELDRVRAGKSPEPAWYAGVVRLRPRQQLSMEHSVRRRAGRLYAETRIESDPSRDRALPESEPPPTERATPDAKKER